KFRGGLATRRVYQYLGSEPAILQLRTDRNPTRPWALLGGREGANSLNRLTGPDGEGRVLPTKFPRTIEPGSVLEHVMASGGGYGDPLERESHLVLRDVLEEKVSPEAAVRDYGADPESVAAPGVVR